jgi:crotonobetainyl-CoA:carnitine CoA-transferase CaiB-like acyl-CoA transferase
LLSGLRALDLTDEIGSYCGKILADLGVEVIKIENPGGDQARKIGPFWGNTPDPERSLSWFALNSGKKGITLNIESDEGKSCLKKLAEGSDFIIESSIPEYLETLGLGYEQLQEINPKLILTSITPYGRKGPYKNYQGSDISFMAMSGLMSIIGYEDRAPLRLGLDQSYLLAGTQAAIGSLFALYQRHFSGYGQEIDVSVNECLVLANYREPLMWEWEKRVAGRTGDRLFRGKGTTKQVWACKDGFVTWNLIDNPRMLRSLVSCMDEEGKAGNLTSIDWDQRLIADLSTEEIKSIEEPVASFFKSHKKNELEQLSKERNLALSVIHEIEDVMTAKQLKQRNFWCDLEYPELGSALKIPGSLFHSEEAPVKVCSKAPRIGEHNHEIYIDELGFTQKEVSKMMEAQVI